MASLDDTLKRIERLEPDLINLNELEAARTEEQQLAIVIAALLSTAISLKHIADNSDKVLLELRQLQHDVHKIRHSVGKSL